ncbi:NAD(P)H-binding protein [Kaistia geumhonensis]|uniref:NADH-flavin reductase n=1 Tax=Kaistia geumhonensis TaxID=410839 RepID=A0ABU0M9K1_9HYPH|nr:NAD(P)H-binding protein [Kaistia geumhonensis]MCX5480843.1 NAD(P)H-binding protein [Kaistia geumhonensis]MDQ0517453.1 putative NADH-flavin reductase [Kaistia geumhonensis]
MTAAKRITIIGGTGYAGSAIAREAAKRGHKVTSVSRSVPPEPIAGVTYVASGIEGAGASIADADVIVGAFSPRGTNRGALVKVYADLAKQAADTGARLILVGGFSCLRRTTGAPRMLEAEGFPDGVPAEIVAEAQENLDVLNNLLADTTGVDWLFVSPAMEFSAWQPGEDRGRYRIGDEVALFDENGKSAISGVDYARAVLDEIEHPTRQRAQIGVAY